MLKSPGYGTFMTSLPRERIDIAVGVVGRSRERIFVDAVANAARHIGQVAEPDAIAIGQRLALAAHHDRRSAEIRPSRCLIYSC